MFREHKTRVGYRERPVSTGVVSQVADRSGPGSVATSLPPPKAAPLPAVTQEDLQWEQDKYNPFRRIAFVFALVTIYVRFSVIHEALAVALNLNLYILYLILPPTFAGIVITGGVRRTLRARTALFWVAFVMWLCLSTAFSVWKGDSARSLFIYVRSEWVMLFVVAGLVVTWKECKLVLYTLALAGLSDLVIGRVFMREETNRIDLAMGGSTIGNANDLAAHLILVMAFVLYIVLGTKLPFIFRSAFMGAIAYGLYLITNTASRGALIALVICALGAFFMGSAKVRVALIALVPISFLVLAAILPRATLSRLSTIVTNTDTITDPTVRGDAVGSSDMRRELLKKSLEYTLHHPMFGLGVSQFAGYEGGESRRNGEYGMWHETHNSFTQISSECGIPALILFLCAIGSGFHLALQIYRLAGKNPVNADLRAAGFCLMLAIIGFMSAAFFLSMGYKFYEPAVCGLCIAVYTTGKREIADRQAKLASMQPSVPSVGPLQARVIPGPALSSTLR